MNQRKTTIYKISVITAIAIVIANMIGTGAFTSLGFQLQDLKSPGLILILWILGGVMALSGAFSYAEIGIHIRRSGGEYTFLTEIFSPLLGYLAGWISLTVGFAAPVALTALAVVEYFPYLDLDPTIFSIILVAVITAIHSLSLRSSSTLQNISTLLKVLLIGTLIFIGLSQPAEVDNQIIQADYLQEIASSAFFIALIYVSYSYSGWNAAVYITEEFKDPRRSLIYGLVGGTVIVTVLYTLMQYVFLKHVPVAELVGQVDVGAIAAQKMLGNDIGNFFSLAISILLISGISAMVWVGPRVTAAMAKDHSFWRAFRTGKKGIPVKALWLQFAITTVMLLTGTFEQILIYCGLQLTASSMLTVLGVFVLRKKSRQNPEGNSAFKSPIYPFFQLLFIFFSLAMIVFGFIEKPLEASLGMTNLVIGALSWYVNKKAIQNKTK